MNAGKDCAGSAVRPRIFIYPTPLPPWPQVYDGRLEVLRERIRGSMHHTANGACADFFLVSNHQFAGGQKRSSAAVAQLYEGLARRWPFWNDTSARGLARHLVLTPQDHGPGDCMYDRGFVRRPGLYRFLVP